MYYPRIYVLAMSRLHNASEAEEVAQQTMISVWQKLGALKTLEAFPAWITRIAINNCNATMRRGAKSTLASSDEVFAEIPEMDEELLPEPYVLREDLKKRLGDVVDELGKEQREAVVLYYYNQLSIDEISQATGISQNTVKSRLGLARKFIKGRLRAEESRTGVHYYGAAGIPFVFLGSAIHGQFAVLEPAPEVVVAARDEVMATIGAYDAHPASESAATDGTGPAYLDELVAELRALSLITLPLVPAGSLWPKMEGASFEGDSLTLEDYLQQLRSFKEKAELLEHRLTLAAEDLAARI
jgi:RNA polymerase sigma factor (sigma-70 family)